MSRLHTIIFDFDGVFTDNTVYVAEDGREIVRCSRADGLGMDILRRWVARNGDSLKFFILSTETNPVVLARAKKLKTECRHGVSDKLATVQAYFAEQRPTDATPFDGLMFVGNDLNDLALMERAAYSVVPSDAHPLVRKAATYALPERGGDGFVRALIERLLQVNTLSMEEVRGLVSDR